MEAFLPIGILLLLALAMGGGIFTLSSLLGPKNRTNPQHLTPYECGVKSEGGARTPFKSRFYLIAVLFLLFDVEAAFFFPWALVYRDSLASGGTFLVAILIYLVFLVLGLAYIYRKNALELR